MNLLDTTKIAIKAIFTNKVRSCLTMLGVIIGVSSVVMLISLGKGLEAFVVQSFEDLGANNIFISPGNLFDEEGGFGSMQDMAVGAITISFTKTDVRQLQRLRQYVEKVAYWNAQGDTLRFLSNSEQGMVIGTNANYNQVLITNLEKGRWFTHSENESGERVVVLGYKIAQDLFGEVDPIRKKIRIGTVTFNVVGVAEEKGGAGFGGPSLDDYTYIPFETYSRIYDTSRVIEMGIRANPEVEIDNAIQAIEENMLQRYKDDEFSVYDQGEILSVIQDILGMITIALGGIAAISLLVGGIGIMNIMLVSVTERTKEIGLRKALGATPNQILIQFLIEAAFLSILGGLIGLGIAFGGSLAIQNVFPAKITTEAVLLAFGVSTAVGLIFGAAPARKASRLSPIEALRYE
jgi:putative ABC transport system permease protein